MPAFSRMRLHDGSNRAGGWRREGLRTNLWLVPALEALVAVVLFIVTIAVDRAVYDGHLKLPTWVLSGSADGARELL